MLHQSLTWAFTFLMVRPLQQFPFMLMIYLAMIRSLQDNFAFAPDYGAPAEKAGKWTCNSKGVVDLDATKI